MNSKTSKDNQYRVTIEEINTEEPRKLVFDYQDREELFNTVKNLKQGSGLDPDTAIKVSVALRILGPLMIQNRKHELFIDFMPHFKSFMQKLKRTVKESVNAK